MKTSLFTLSLILPSLASANPLALSVANTLSHVTLPSGKSVEIAYCTSPHVKGDRAVIACSEKTEDGSDTGLVIELAKSHTPGRPSTWLKKHVHAGPGISSDSAPLITESGNILLSVSSAANENYSDAGILVLDPSFKVVTERELPRTEYTNWIPVGDHYVYSTTARVNSMYPTQNDLVLLDDQGNEVNRVSIPGSKLGEIIALPNSVLAIESEEQPDAHDPSKNMGQVVLFNMDTKQALAFTIPETRSIKLVKGNLDGSLYAVSEKSDVFQITYQFLGSVTAENQVNQFAAQKIYSASEAIGQQLQSDFKPLVLQDGSISILSRSGDNSSFYYHLSIIKPDGSALHRKLFTAGAAAIGSSFGLVHARDGREFIWVGAVGWIYAIDGSGTLNYALELPRTDNPQTPRLDSDSGLWWTGNGAGLHAFSTSQTPLSLDSQIFGE